MEIAEIVVEISKIVSHMVHRVQGVYLARGHNFHICEEYVQKMVTAMLTPTYIEADRRIGNFAFMELQYQEGNIQQPQNKFHSQQNFIKQELNNSSIFIFENDREMEISPFMRDRKQRQLRTEKKVSAASKNKFQKEFLPRSRPSPCFFARPTLEETQELKNWIIAQTQLGKKMQITTVQFKARQICANKSFKASRGWVKKFIERNPQLHKHFPKIYARFSEIDQNSSNSEISDSYLLAKQLNKIQDNENIIKLPNTYLPRPSPQELEKLKEWIIDQSRMGNRLSVKDIQAKARIICSNIGFKACHSWVRKFMDRTPEIHKYFPRHYSPSASEEDEPHNNKIPLKFHQEDSSQSDDGLYTNQPKMNNKKSIKIFQESEQSSSQEAKLQNFAKNQKEEFEDKSDESNLPEPNKINKENELAHISKYCGENSIPKFRITKHNLFNTEQEQEKQLSL